jgi:hypothetical protein
MEASEKQNIFILWFLWQFYEMPVFLLQVWKNYLMFAANFFSVPLLLKTFFSPWRRYNWRYPKGFDLTEFFNTLISNAFSRFLGAFMRIILIVMGILFQIFVALAGLIFFLGWILIPFIAIAGFLIFLMI